MKQWGNNFLRSLDFSNCSSNSVFFYLLFFLIGSFEMILSTTLCFDLQLYKSVNDIKKYSVNHSLFSIALILELVYYIFARVATSYTYCRYNDNKSTCHMVTVTLIHILVTILPTEMLIFFGYNDGKSDDFKTRWLNLAWGRRIITCLRLII